MTYTTEVKDWGDGGWERSSQDAREAAIDHVLEGWAGPLARVPQVKPVDCLVTAPGETAKTYRVTWSDGRASAEQV